jgi:hypothetical protein
LFRIAVPQPFVQGPKVGGAVPTDIAQGTGIVAQRSSVFQSKRDVLKDIEEDVRRGMTREQAVQNEVTQLVEKGVTTEAAVREIASIVQPSGPGTSGALIFIKPPTFEQRIVAVLSSLFGYKEIGGSTFGMRVISIVLSAATLGMAYFRGDLQSIYNRITQTYNAISVSTPAPTVSAAPAMSAIPAMQQAPVLTASNSYTNSGLQTAVSNMRAIKVSESKIESALSKLGYTSYQTMRILNGQDLTNTELITAQQRSIQL